MSHTSGRYGDLDYPTLAKYGFLAGATMFVVGALGEIALSAGLAGGPGWLGTLLFDVEVLGIVLGFLSPLLFGVVMPLTE